MLRRPMNIAGRSQVTMRRRAQKAHPQTHTTSGFSEGPLFCRYFIAYDGTDTDRQTHEAGTVSRSRPRKATPPYAIPLAWQAVRLLASVYSQATADGIDQLTVGGYPSLSPYSASPILHFGPCCLLLGLGCGLLSGFLLFLHRSVGAGVCVCRDVLAGQSF